MPQKLQSVNKFVWIEAFSQFNEDFMKNYNKESDQNIFSNLMFNILKNYMKLITIYQFYQKEWRLKKSKKL